MSTKVHYMSERDDWETPQRLFDELDREFHFTRDVCADRHNHKVSSYWDIGDDALSPGHEWKGMLWMNPPYGRAIGTWVKKAYESRATATVVCLIPARTDSRWWHRYALKADEIRFIKGRLKFLGAKDGAPFPSAIVVFRDRPGAEALMSDSPKFRVGQVHPSRTMFLRVHGADAKNGKLEYECSAEARSMMPIVLSRQTGKSFSVSWQELIELAIEAGIDERDVSDSRTRRAR